MSEYEKKLYELRQYLICLNRQYTEICPDSYADRKFEILAVNNEIKRLENLLNFLNMA